MKLLIFTYLYNVKYPYVNLGDYIQSLSIENALIKLGYSKDDFIYYDRDYLSYYNGEPAICVMQGWFSDSLAWLPSNNITPVYIGFHSNDNAKIIIEDENYRDSFEHQTFGCRDLSTKSFFEGQGLQAYFSRCMTLTFDRRTSIPNQDKTFIVDIPDSIHKLLSKNVLSGSEIVQQRNIGYKKASQYYQMEYKEMAKNLLYRYKNEATLVITSALHCALPCIAMGIPVVFINPDGKVASNNTRFEVMRDLIPIYSKQDIIKNRVDWSPKILNIEELKMNMLSNLSYSIGQTSSKHSQLSIAEIRERISKEIHQIPINNRGSYEAHTSRNKFLSKIKASLKKILKR